MPVAARRLLREFRRHAVEDFVVVLNAGSSSLKFCTYSRPQGGGSWQLADRGQIEGIGTAPHFSAKDGEGAKTVDESLGASVRDAAGALDALATWLRNRHQQAAIVGVGHRVVHGGANFAGPVSARLPDVPQVACFDTSFHRGHPAVAELVPLPAEIRAKGVQRYGFHGLSYEYIASVLPDVAPEIAGGRVIVAHLGSGASLCAMRKGRSIDTTLGFTALDGLCMGTRPGALDPGVVLYLFQTLGLSAKEVENILYKKSGLLGISGISNDMRDLISRTEPEAQLAVNYFVYRVT